jgi:hypothetical protein
MILSYSLRLIALCFASFFVVQAVAGLAVWLAERPAIRLAEQSTPRSAAHFLFWMRVLPGSLALGLAAGICAPSYLRFEQNMAGEQVGSACLALAFLGVVVWAFALLRGARTAIDTIRFTRLCRRRASVVSLTGEPSQMLVIQGSHPFLVQSGIVRPYIVISQRLLMDFPAAELDAALEHERAHWASRDNCKRLLFAFLPEILPLGRGFQLLERGWAKFAERAADDSVSARGLGPALALAAALVRLARIRGTIDPQLWIPHGVSSLAGTEDLSGRVQRLLSPAPAMPVEPRAYTRALWAVGSILAAASLAVLASPVLLSSVHELLERMLR